MSFLRAAVLGALLALAAVWLTDGVASVRAGRRMDYARADELLVAAGILAAVWALWEGALWLDRHLQRRWRR